MSQDPICCQICQEYINASINKLETQLFRKRCNICIPGPRGKLGRNGMQGPTGPRGSTATGSQGSIGITGITGPQGETGFTGPQGICLSVQGETGPIGPQGEIGVTGPQGSCLSIPGETGFTGPQGETGVTGFPGSCLSVQGEIGQTGPQGEIGPTGPQGEFGPIGETGPIGSQGLAGPDGPVGFTGACCTGPQGSTGETGSTGSTGSPGPSIGCSIYGDGSAGNLILPTGGTGANWIINVPVNGNFMFQNVIIGSNTTLTVASGTKIRVLGSFINNGTIEVVSPLSGEHRDNTLPFNNFALEKANAQSIPITYEGGLAHDSQVLLNLLDPGILGGGNGALGSNPGTFNNGGNGGGSLSIYSQDSLINNTTGIIRSNGSAGTIGLISSLISGGSGGGAGGIIILVSKTNILNLGLIETKGGDGGQLNASGGGGGGGLVHFLSPINNTGMVNVNGGLTVNAMLNIGFGGGGGAMGGKGGVGQHSAIGAMNGDFGSVLITTVDDPELLFF